MAEPSKHINYSFEDIQRYVQGKMPAAEMHDMEKAALQDPFLADAIEGFNEADLAVAKQHLNEINASLFAEKQQTKVVAFNKRTQWLNVAALIIVLAGIGIVASYFFRSSNQQIEVAKLQREPGENKTTKDSVTTGNSSALAKKTDSSLFIAENKIVKKTQPLSAKRKADGKAIVADNNILTKAEADSFKADIASTTISSAPKQENAMMATSVAVADTQAQLQVKVSGLSVLPSVFSGKVVDENNKPIAGVTIASADKKAAVLTDINGNFNLQKTDTLVNVTASTVGYGSENLALKQGMNNPIMLKQTNSSLNDVAVVGYGTERKKNAYADSITRTQRNANDDSAMPVGGWSSFNNYVITQLNKDTTTSAITSANNLVELEFLIDKSGNPYDIKVTRSLNEQHSTKAVEILKNGPKWTKPARKKKAKVVINF